MNRAFLLQATVNLGQIMAAQNAVELYKELDRNLKALIGPVRFSAEINLRLERITHLLECLDNPHLAYASIHVGGTSGKGSTCTMIASMLTHAGYKTGLHISPHIQILNERHQINSKVTSSTRLAELYSEIEAAIETVAAESPFGSPSYFEVQIALAFHLFRQEAVDVAVIEVGLGGTLDASNALPATVAVITNIGLDHIEILGDTIEAIASDKAGIIKSGQMVISGAQQADARRVIEQCCQTVDAELWQMGQAFKYEMQDNDFIKVVTPSQTYTDLEPGMRGDFQFANAACAVAAVSALGDFDVPEKAVRSGLKAARMPGRMEVVQRHPTVVLDGAHNPDKMKVASQAIDQYFAGKRRIVVFSLKSDKAANDVLRYVLNDSDLDLFLVTAFRVKGLWEPMDAKQLAELAIRIKPDLDVRIVPDPIRAVEQALSEAKPDDLIWITGSLYLVGDAREYWYPSTDLIARAEQGLSGSLSW